MRLLWWKAWTNRGPSPRRLLLVWQRQTVKGGCYLLMLLTWLCYYLTSAVIFYSPSHILFHVFVQILRTSYAIHESNLKAAVWTAVSTNIFHVVHYDKFKGVILEGGLMLMSCQISFKIQLISEWVLNNLIVRVIFAPETLIQHIHGFQKQYMPKEFGVWVAFILSQ